SAASTSSPRPNPPQVRVADIRPVTWVIAKTKTRSKNSSSHVTGASRSFSVTGAVLLGDGAVVEPGGSCGEYSPRGVPAPDHPVRYGFDCLICPLAWQRQSGLLSPARSHLPACGRAYAWPVRS